MEMQQRASALAHATQMKGLDGAATVAALNSERAEAMSPLRAWSWANWRSVRSSEEEKEGDGKEGVVEEEDGVEEVEEEEEEKGVDDFFIPALSALE